MKRVAKLSGDVVHTQFQESTLPAANRGRIDVSFLSLSPCLRVFANAEWRVPFRSNGGEAT